MRSLIHQKDDLLAVAHSLYGQFQYIADQHAVSIQDIWEICYTARFDIHAPTYHFRSEDIEKPIGPKYDQIEDQVLIVIASTHRCSSIVENFNRRLRPYIDERKTLTKKTLGLYQFIPNHRPFQRSYHPLLVGKTPAEALTGKPHLHWLELLGYQRFQSAELAANPLSLNARRMPNGRNHSLAYYFFRIPRSPHIDLRTIGVKGVLKYPTRSGPVV